jgi:hypothetical protein
MHGQADTLTLCDQGLHVLREAAAAEAAAWEQEIEDFWIYPLAFGVEGIPAMVQVDTLHDSGGIYTSQGGGKVSYFVGNRYLGGKQTVVGVLDHFGGAGIHFQEVNVPAVIEFPQMGGTQGVVSAQDDTVGIQEIFQSRGLSQKFRVEAQAEFPQFFPGGLLQKGKNDGIDSSRQYRTFDNNGVIIGFTAENCADVAGSLLHVAQVNLAIRVRGADSDDGEFSFRYRLCKIGSNLKTARLNSFRACKPLSKCWYRN